MNSLHITIMAIQLDKLQHSYQFFKKSNNDYMRLFFEYVSEKLKFKTLNAVFLLKYHIYTD